MSTYACYPCGAPVGIEENKNVQAIFTALDELDSHIHWDAAPEGEDSRTSAMCSTLNLIHCIGIPANFDDTDAVVVCSECLHRGLRDLSLEHLVTGCV
jgi:hypothetical protein